MKERPILFSGPMVRAILDGRKTQTRRVFGPEMIRIEPHPKCGFYYETFARRNGEVVSTGQGPFRPNDWSHYCPYGEPGDRLWVRETWRTRREWDRIAPSKLPVTEDSSFTPLTLREQYITYVESDTQANKLRGKLRPSIYMPRWASRITLEIVSIRVERLQDISEEDAEAEGIVSRRVMDDPYPHFFLSGSEWQWDYAASIIYANLWESINGPDSWQANPWVWVVQFRRVEQ